METTVAIQKIGQGCRVVADILGAGRRGVGGASGDDMILGNDRSSSFALLVVVFVVDWTPSWTLSGWFDDQEIPGRLSGDSRYSRFRAQSGQINDSGGHGSPAAIGSVLSLFGVQAREGDVV